MKSHAAVAAVLLERESATPIDGEELVAGVMRDLETSALGENEKALLRFVDCVNRHSTGITADSMQPLYAAVDPVMNREVVVKAVQIVPPGPPLRAEARRRIEQAFDRQAQAAGRLHHPHRVGIRPRLWMILYPRKKHRLHFAHVNSPCRTQSSRDCSCASRTSSP